MGGGREEAGSRRVKHAAWHGQSHSPPASRHPRRLAEGDTCVTRTGGGGAGGAGEAGEGWNGAMKGRLGDGPPSPFPGADDPSRSRSFASDQFRWLRLSHGYSVEEELIELTRPQARRNCCIIIVARLDATQPRLACEVRLQSDKPPSPAPPMGMSDTGILHGESFRHTTGVLMSCSLI